MVLPFEDYKNIPVFDQSKIEQLIQLGKEIEEDVLSQLSEVHNELTAETLRNLQLAISEKNITNIRKSSHKFKSSCGNLGLVRLHKICLDLELVATQAERSNDFDQTTYQKAFELIQLETETSNKDILKFNQGAA